MLDEIIVLVFNSYVLIFEVIIINIYYIISHFVFLFLSFNINIVVLTFNFVVFIPFVIYFYIKIYH